MYLKAILLEQNKAANKSGRNAANDVLKEIQVGNYINL
jgi:hypothetical protein